MQILVIAENALWQESFLSLANGFSSLLVFGRSGKECLAVVIHAEDLAPRTLDRLVVSYASYPIFIVGHDKSVRRKYINKVTFIPSGLDISKVVRLIEMFIGRLRQSEKPAFNLKEELVLNCLCEGMTNKEIARYSGLPLSSIKHYLPSIYSKLNIKRRTELALLNGEIIV